MFLFYVLSFFKKWDTIQGGTLFKEGHHLRKYCNLVPFHFRTTMTKLEKIVSKCTAVLLIQSAASKKLFKKSTCGLQEANT